MGAWGVGGGNCGEGCIIWLEACSVRVNPKLSPFFRSVWPAAPPTSVRGAVFCCCYHGLMVLISEQEDIVGKGLVFV